MSGDSLKLVTVPLVEQERFDEQRSIAGIPGHQHEAGLADYLAGSVQIQRISELSSRRARTALVYIERGDFNGEASDIALW